MLSLMWSLTPSHSTSRYTTTIWSAGMTSASSVHRLRVLAAAMTDVEDRLRLADQNKDCCMGVIVIKSYLSRYILSLSAFEGVGQSFTPSPVFPPKFLFPLYK